MSRTGSASEVITASRFRLVRRSPRPAMATQSARPASGRGRRRAPTVAARGTVSSDTGGLLLLLVVGPVGGVAGQGQEHVVEGGAVDGEPVHGLAGRVDLVEQGPDVGGAAVGGDPDDAAVAVVLDGPAAQAPGD